MRVNFFEEFPTRENMVKLDLVDWPSTVLVATTSLQEFIKIRKEYAREYPHITFGWWPTIPGAYWVSGFADPSDLEHLFSELSSVSHPHELPILIDMELPINKCLIFKNFFRLYVNKKRIAKFFEQAPQFNLKIYTAEYPAPGLVLYKILAMIGISPSFSLRHIKLPMCYSSMGLKYFGRRLWENVKTFESKFTFKHMGRVGFGLGTIAVGVMGNEPILSPENLEQDLQWAKKSGAEEVFIFRLGGLTDPYVRVIKNLGK